MRREVWCRAVVVLCAVVALSGATQTATVVRPTKFDYTMTTLDNGLQVVFLEDHSTPIVHLALWYHVGSKDERPGRTGFAHLFEHLMFKGSRNVASDEHPSVISTLGGESNAETDEDTTVYWETVPAQHLPLILWLEADRMASLDVSEEKFRAELEVVKEERRMRFENPPFGLLPELIYDRAFTTHPYRHQTIGSMTDLEAASIADVRAFHDTYYVPNNATAVLVGDFDTADARRLVQKYLGRVSRGKPVPRDIPAEPVHTSETRVTLTQPWPLAAVVVSYHITRDGDPDAYPLHVLAKILSDGDSSRLYRSLVYQKQVALAVDGAAKLIEHPNLFYAVAVVPNGTPPAGVLTELQAEIDRVKADGVTADELNRAKRQFARDYILNRETVRDKALQLGHAVVIHNDIRTADGEFDLFQAVTQEDVKRVAQKYFVPASRMVMTVLPAAPAGGRP